MNFCAIICEYNPMHFGHIYQIDQAKKLSGCKNVCCVMGGNFSQRGEVCVLNKYEKTQIALKNGVDLVMELPTVFSSQSAQIFALSSVKLLNSIKNITHLCFGSECDNLAQLNQIANFLLHPTKQFKKSFKSHLKLGYSYSLSIQKSLENDEWKNIISKPNNMLSIEYLKALKITKSKIIPVVVKRESDYNSLELNTKYASASAIRNAILNDKIEDIKNFIPKICYEKLQNATKFNKEFFNTLLKYEINTNKELRKIFLINEGVENYILNNKTATKRYSTNKLNRTKLNILLKIKKSIIKKLYKVNSLPYIKVLGAKKECLKHLVCNTNLIIRKNDISKKNKLFIQMEEVENNANVLFNLLTNSNLKKESLYVKSIIE